VRSSPPRALALARLLVVEILSQATWSHNLMMDRQKPLRFAETLQQNLDQTEHDGMSQAAQQPRLEARAVKPGRAYSNRKNVDGQPKVRLETVSEYKLMRLLAST
jgi:hypothetical protein